MHLRGVRIRREDVEGDQVGALGEDVDAIDPEEERGARGEAWRWWLGGCLDDAGAWLGEGGDTRGEEVATR